jgi:hypothetical protein
MGNNAMRDKVEHMREEVNPVSRDVATIPNRTDYPGHIGIVSQEGKLVSYFGAMQSLLTYTPRL